MTPAPSPLFEPVLWEGSHFKILDELALPDKVEYLTVTEWPQALDAVKEMKTRAFGQVLTFLYSGALVAEGHKGNNTEALRQELARMTEQFCDARPTFDFRGLGEFFSECLGRLPGDANAGKWIAEGARRFGAQIVKGRHARAKRAAEILPSPAQVLTHCNISGELVVVAQHCREMRKPISVFATETRPYLQGSRLTAWELSQAGVAVSVIPDCAVAQVMAKGEVNAVLVGADRSAQNGDIINKVGTYPIALMAKEYGVPFHALVQDPRSLARGDDVQIEERPAAELLTFQGRPLVPEGAERLVGHYPAFDVTPAHLITHLVGFDGLFTPESFRQKFQKSSLRSGDKSQGRGKYLLVYGLPKPSSYSYLRSALRAEQATHILVPEMRPELWGVNWLARELLKRDAPTTLISDNMMGILLARGEVRRLYLFYAGLSAEGPTGICGSLLAVRLARIHGVPVELLEAGGATSTSVDRDVSTFLGQRVSPAGARVYPLTKEVLPWTLLRDNQGNGS